MGALTCGELTAQRCTAALQASAAAPVDIAGKRALTAQSIVRPRRGPERDEGLANERTLTLSLRSFLACDEKNPKKQENN